MSTSTQTDAVTNVGSAFGAAMPTGLTPAQQAAYTGVQNAFKVTPATPIPTATTLPTTQPQSAAPKPYTAFSSDQGAQYASENSQTLQTLKNTGLTVGQDGLARFSDMSYATAPSDSVQTENGTWQKDGVQYAIGPVTSVDPELKAITDQITAMKTQFDTTSRQNIDNIKQQFDMLIKKQGDINMRSEASLDQSLLMAGSTRYAQQSSEGQHTAMMSYGIQQIADLNTKEQSAIIQAQQAQDAGDMKLMDSALNVATQARKDKQAAAQALSEKLVKANDDLKVRQKAAAQDTAISSILSQGITDPQAILKQMNEAGYNVNAKDVADSINNLNPDAKDVHQIMLDAANKGATPDVLKAIGQARDVTSAIAAAGTSLVDPASPYGQYLSYTKQATSKGQNPVSYQDWAEANKARADKAAAALSASSAYTNAYNATAGKNAAEAATGGGGGYNGDFAATIESVANLESSVAGKKQVAANLKSFIASGDYKSAYSQIANTVEAGLVGESKQRFANARTDAQVMQGMKEAIQKYAAAGGDMNILKGTTESIYNKLGTVSDPRYEAQAVALQREFQTYRNTMTGAAFSPQESAEYQAVNPSGNKTLSLNVATIDGALQQLNNRVSKTIESRVPSAAYIKEYADQGTPGDTLIQKESDAQGTLQTYLQSNPNKKSELDQRIKVMEQQTGKPINAVDFLQAFPEYAQQPNTEKKGNFLFPAGSSFLGM